jgi:hypothetical protein
MGLATRHGAALVLVAFLAACGTPESPGNPIEATVVAASLQASLGPPLLLAWITDPEKLPAGLMGRNNCTFAFGQATAQWDLHPDGACWERPGPDG